ncbi:MAG: NAD(P)H-dependent oxidoreductase subunit E [Bacteroidales bacterium]
MNTQKILNTFKPVKENLLPILHSLQNSHPQNYLSNATLKAIAKYLNISLSSVYGVVGYYSMFSLKPRGRYIIRVCTSPICAMIGSQDILTYLSQRLDVNLGETTLDGVFTLEASECLGQCANAPSMMINKQHYGNLTPELIESILQQLQNS